MPLALIITTAGINCDRELDHAFRLAGAETESILLKRLIEQPELIDRFDLIGLPGGFSYGDAIAAGRIGAQLMRQSLYPALVRAIKRCVPIIAPCNGFQMAVQMGLLPGPVPGATWPDSPAIPTTALTHNESNRFIDHWCHVETPSNTRCIWMQGLDAMSAETQLLPIAHIEGRFNVESDDLINQLHEHGQIALRYTPEDNPNGSTGNIAGICDATGRVLGLMPHPERFTRRTQHPFWTRFSSDEQSGEPMGLRMFRNAVAHAATVSV